MAIVLASRVSPARWAALEILRKVESGSFSSVLLASDELRLEPSDRALCHELVLGVLRWQLKLDKIIEHFSKRRIEDLDQAVVLSLRLGLYQLKFLSRVPQSAAVNESVKLVQAARVSSARPFVNAVLRRATREPDFEPTSNVTDLSLKLSIETSHPRFLIDRWIEAFGFEETSALAHANNKTPVLAFRVVKTRVEEQDLLKRLDQAGITVEPSLLTPGAWRALNGSRILRELANNGEVYLQDEASQLVARTVGTREGERVLDLCSAPGGKATLMSEQGALVVASDSSMRRLETVAQSIARQNVSSVNLLQLDANHTLPFQDSSFDHVLVDAPCSGTGTLRHNPEIRWRISADDIRALANQQFGFLDNAARVVKPRGRLIYSTCSIEVEEDEQVVERFIRAHPEFEQVTIGAAKTLRTWPQHNDTDGFFLSVFEKTEG